MRREEDWISERRGGETELPGWFWRLIFLPGYIRRLLLLLSLFLSSLLYFSLRWLLSNWSELSVEEILYHLKAPMQGASSGLLRSYLLFALLPSLLLLLLFLLFFRRCRNFFLFYFVRRILFLFPLLFLLLSIRDSWQGIGLRDFLVSQFTHSDFIDRNYVDPRSVELRFPEKKRNLIYIYMESTEMSFSDEAHGGAFPMNCIPELTELAEENEDFSGGDGKLNGAYSMPGSTWTMGAIFAMSSGLPLKISIDKNAMDSQKSFFPGVQTLGDILKEEGYEQSFLLGSVGYFGGRRLYFQSHGDYAVKDYSYWKRQGKFRPDYWVNWGFEDEKLYSYAKEELSRLSRDGRPFNLTLLTVDTHFPDGYVCRLCRREFGKNQYANVFACASRQLADFVNWAKTQPWYENTTIVVTGDHPTMDHDFCKDVPKSYVRRVYTAYINAPIAPARRERREYSSFDDFPTTLASLGVEIEGERLGLGTNLYSDQPTLMEKFGRDYEREELKKRSELMLRLGQIDKAAAFESRAAKDKEEREKERQEKERKKKEKRESRRESGASQAGGGGEKEGE